MGETLDFTNDTEQITEQANKDAQEALKWDKITSKDMEKEIKGVIERTMKVSADIQGFLFTCSGFEQTRDTLRAYRISDLGSSGWVASFLNANDVSIFKAPQMMMDEEGKKYKMMTDLKNMLPLLESISKVTEELDPIFQDGYTMLKAEKNFMNADGLTESLYLRIKSDILSVYEFVNKSWDSLEQGAVSCREYYNEQTKNLTDKNAIPDKVKAEYFKKRCDDYLELIDGTSFNEGMDTSSEPYRLKSAKHKKIGSIDKYSASMSKAGGSCDAYNNLLPKCDEMMAVLSRAQGTFTTETCSDLYTFINVLALSVDTFVRTTTVAFLNFKGAKKEAPYCFMQAIDVSVKGEYFNMLELRDAWTTGGTKLLYNYDMLHKAIHKHMTEFVFKRGLIKQ